MAELSDIEHLLFLLAEDVPISALASLPARVTTCRAYHLTPEGEDRVARVWPAYAVALRDANVTVHLRASVPDTFGDVTVIEARQDTVESLIGRLDELPPATLVAIALGGGDTDPVEDESGRLGAPGVLLLRTPWGQADWVSEEVCDHTSLIQLCERWTAARGREARMRLSAWRRRVCGDLVDALDLGGDDLPDLPGRVLARPAPYLPSADLRLDDDGVTLLLANAGPDVSRAAHLVVDDGAVLSHHTVPASLPERPKRIDVAVASHDGRHHVTVTGPNHYRCRLTGGDVRLEGGVEPEGEPDAPALRVRLGNDTAEPVTFVVEDRRTSVRREVAVAPGAVEVLRIDPWEADHGWYDLGVTCDADPSWLREYAGHLPARGLTAVAHEGTRVLAAGSDLED